ncbi:MAG: hypothetical protein AAGJ87_15770, partial [Pseudomonadota bacterium]
TSLGDVCAAALDAQMKIAVQDAEIKVESFFMAIRYSVSGRLSPAAVPNAKKHENSAISWRGNHATPPSRRGSAR